MKNELTPYDRRQFLKGLSLTVGAASILPLPAFAFSDAQNSSPIDPLEATEPLPPVSKEGKLGIALVGLGQYSTHQLAPALLETKNTYLAGIVTGTPSKAKAWKKHYNIPDKNVYNYENFDEIANNKDIDIVYVVLPTAMHAEFTIRAAKAKKHVICEKPMATSVEDAQRMIDACKQNGVQLAIGYRLHFEPFNKRVMELGQKQVYGKVKSLTAKNGSNNTNGSVDEWRLNKDLAGGGSIMDMGVYCVQGICYTMGKTPVAVTGKFGEVTHPTVFHSIEQSISWQMIFDDGVVAECHSSYAKSESELSAVAEKGWWKLDPAYGYSGKKGETSEGKMNFPDVYEQVHQMDSQAESFRKNEKSIVPGEMGLRDIKIIMAVYESARNGGKRVQIT